MIVCNNCGFRGAYKGVTCPSCNKKITLSRSEIEERREDIKRALSRRNYESALENYEILADLGDAEAQRELGKLLEHGEVINRDLDRAMKYFLMAAEQNDPYSAYRYSRLASRTSDVAARFWLVYSAILGCKEAYSAAAEQFSYEGDEIKAHYYYALAAEDDTDAIVTLARRYCEGIGTEPSEAYAKWYLDHLALPPIHAIKLAYKLRAVDAEEPPRPSLESEEEHLRSLARDAEKHGFSTAFLHINELLADMGNSDALATLGTLYAEGVGCEKNLVVAIQHLERAAAEGNAQAFYYLGGLFTTGKSFEVDINRALKNYTAAAEHGFSPAYETMGDIFCDGKFIARDLAYAIELYDKAAADGIETAKKKSEDLRHKREAFFKYAKEAENLDPVQCFRNCAISTAMGYTPATRMLAHLYEVGRGTKKDRGRAFFWYKTAADAGDKYAYYDLGRCYAYGIGTAFNYELALASFRTAESAGYTTAKREIARLESNRKKRVADKHFSTAMRLLYKKKFKAAKCYLDLCMLLENPKAIYTLGCLYEFGLGIEVNKDYAYGLYEEAYKLKFRDPRAKFKLRILKLVR